METTASEAESVPVDRRRWIAFVAAAIVVTLGITVGAFLALRGAGPPSPPRVVTSKGIRISVPADWARNATRCGTPVRDTYVVDVDKAPTCALTPRPRVDYAQIRASADLSVDPVAAVATERTDIDGMPARRGDDRLPDGRVRWVVVLPDLKVLAVVVAGDPALAQSIIDSVHRE